MTSTSIEKLSLKADGVASSTRTTSSAHGVRSYVVAAGRDVDKIECLERGYAGKVMQLLFVAEFVLLVEFVEVIIPVLYCA